MSISARSIVFLAALLPSAGATTITIVPAANIAQATADRNSWLIQTFGPGTTPNPVQVDIDDVTPSRKSEDRILQLLTAFHSLYFFMTGVEGNVQIRTADGTRAHVHGDDDSLYFVGITSSTDIGSIQWRGPDDFGLIDFGTPNVPASTPEPATWLGLATGLVMITLALSRKRLRCPTISKESELPSPPGRPLSRRALHDRPTRPQNSSQATASPR